MDKNNLHVRKNIHHTTVTILATSIATVLVIFVGIAYAALNASLTVSGDLEYEARTLYRIIASNSRGLDTNIDFSATPTATTSGVYKMNSTNNDKYPVYYYRGIVSNNNVKFANFCWNIVRTTSTGGIKLIYNGKIASNGSCNNDSMTSTVVSSFFNQNYDSADSVNYVFENGTNSEIKETIDQWYTYHMTSYTNKLEDTEWCNDKSNRVEYFDENNSLGLIFYGGYDRFNTKKPSIICKDAEYTYTVNSNKGNKKLKYPVGLLTLDEVMMVGGTSYLSRGRDWWLMTPGTSGINGEGARYFIFSMEYGIGAIDVDRLSEIRPSVSLVQGISISGGNGTTSNPYVILTN